MRRAKSLRIDVHIADAVVWEPVYRTRLKQPRRGDVPDEHRAVVDGADDPGDRSVERLTGQTLKGKLKGEERRRETSLRNGVHHANGVVWEAVSPSPVARKLHRHDGRLRAA